VGLPGSGLNYSVQHGKTSKTSKTGRRSSRDPESIEDADHISPYQVDPETATVAVDRDFLRAVVSFQTGNPAMALAVLAEISDMADAFWLAGVIELRHGNWTSAAEHLLAALHNEADLGQVCARNGVSLAFAYQITPEVTALIGPDPRSTRLALAEAYQEDRKLSEALDVLKAMIRQTPDDLVVALSLAEIAFEADDGRKMKMSDLVAILETTSPVEGLEWARDFMRARALERHGAFSQAIDAYSQAMADKNIPEEMHKLAWYEKALTFEETGDRTRCRQELSGLYAQDRAFADVEARLTKRS
jgi:predicted Zn-dependent protease